jgi:hypothetical protein
MSVQEVAARALGHPVPLALPAEGARPIAAASVAGEPPRTRVAWIGEDGRVVARVACPPARPSRWRPVVATAVTLSEPSGSSDRLVAARAAPDAAGVRVVAALEDPVPDAPVGPDGLALVRLPAETAVVAVDALDVRGEPIGRLAGAGVAELRVSGGTVSGRLGLTHGMAAGIGPGRWVPDLDEAAFEAGYDPWVPDWLPSGLARGDARLEQDAAYPAAPPAVAIAWTGAEDARVLLRQTPAPLASPELGGRGAREVAVGGATGILRGRWLVTLVWETPERAFGLQVRRVPEADAVAARVARSVGPRRPA